MKILLLTQWYPPEPLEFLSELAESLTKLGHTVVVLTGLPNWPTGRLYPGYRFRIVQREKIRGIPIIRVPLYPDHSHSRIKRIVNFISFAVSLMVLGPWIAPRVDVIHVIHPPLTIGWPAWVLSRFQGVPFTYEIQDMWPETLKATGMIGSRHILRLLDLFAKWVYTRAAAIRVISNGFQANLVEKGVSVQKIHIVSNWVDTDLFAPQAPEPGLAASFGMDGRFNVMYAGNIGLAQGLETVLEAALLLRDIKNVQIVLVGEGADLMRLKKIAAEESITNVLFLGRHPIEVMPRLYALADVMLIHLRDDPLFRITVPHKLFSYLACGKPILAAVEGDTAQAVRNAGAGFVCSPDNPISLSENIRRFYTLPAGERKLFGENGRRAALAQYSKEKMLLKIEQMLRTCVQS